MAPALSSYLRDRSCTGQSAPTLGRRMLALEVITGEELFRRLARGYELTEPETFTLPAAAE